MYRHPGLQPLSREHHFALRYAKRLKALGVAAPEQLAACWPLLRERLGRFWNGALAPHFRAEEQQLPWETVDGAYRNRLVREHREIAELVDSVRSAATPDGASVQRLGQLLANHARWEEQVLFPELERRGSEQALSAANDGTEARLPNPQWLPPDPGTSND